MVKDNSDTTSWQGIHRAGELQVNEVAEPEHVFPGAIPLDRETHGDDDVGVCELTCYESTIRPDKILHSRVRGQHYVRTRTSKGIKTVRRQVILCLASPL